MIEWMRMNGDLVENWAFGTVAWLALTSVFVSLGVLGVTAVIVHLRAVWREVRQLEDQDHEERAARVERLLR